MDDQELANLLRRGDAADDPATVDASFIESLRSELLSDLRSSSHEKTGLSRIDSGGSGVSEAIAVDFEPAVEPKRPIMRPLLVAASAVAFVILGAVFLPPDGDERVATQGIEDVGVEGDGIAAAPSSTLVSPTVASTSVPPTEACAAFIEQTTPLDALHELDAEQTASALTAWIGEIDVLRARIGGVVEPETDEALLRVRARLRRLLEGSAPTFAELAQADAEFRSATFGEEVLAECRR